MKRSGEMTTLARPTAVSSASAAAPRMMKASTPCVISTRSASVASEPEHVHVVGPGQPPRARERRADAEILDDEHRHDEPEGGEPRERRQDEPEAAGTAPG